MELFNFNTAYTHMRELYGLELPPDEFESLGLIAWDKIGNKIISLDVITLPIEEDGIINIPCEVDAIEAVYIDAPDYQSTSNMQNSPLTYNQFIESYIDNRKGENLDQLYKNGRLIKYKVISENQIRVSLSGGNVRILYRTVKYDNDGLPMINRKEVDAIAAYCAYSNSFKKALMTKDQLTFQFAQMLEQKWLKLCDHARTPIHLSQNDMDAVGDVKYSWDRKTYHKSFKPVK